MRYLWNLIRTSFAPRNWGITFFILLNCSFLFSIVARPMGMSPASGIVLAGMFVLFSVLYITVVLCIGGWIIRLVFHGNRMIAGNDFSNTAIAFARAYNLAVAQDPSISRNVRLYICNVNFPAAYAFGRTTILISSAATELPQQQIQALLLSKFAQLSNHDAERHLLLIAGNILFVTAVVLIKVFVYIAIGFIVIASSCLRMLASIFLPRMHVGGSGLFAMNAYFSVCQTISNFIETVLLFLLNLLIRIALLTSQSNYFYNDRFVCNCGCSGELRQYLQLSEPTLSGYRSTLETITATAPAKQARISRLEEYMASGTSSPRRPAHSETDPLRITGSHGPSIIPPEPRTPTQNRVNGFSVISRNDQ